jgi:hypothetical protein
MLGIKLVTLKRILCPGVRRPGEVIVAGAEPWLAVREAEAGSAAPSGRLSVDQRKRLHFLFERDPIGTRRKADLTHTQLQQPVAGAALDPAVMTRLTGFLTGDQATTSG